METLVNCDIVSDIKRIDKIVGENQLYQDFGGFVLQLVKGEIEDWYEFLRRNSI